MVKRYHDKRYIDVSYYTEINVELDEENLLCFMISREEGLEKFNNARGTDIQLPEDFDFSKNKILVCEGHGLRKAYYVLADEKLFSKNHFLYLVLNKQFENKIYLYIVPYNFTSWMLSDRYEEGVFDGIIYE